MTDSNQNEEQHPEVGRLEAEIDRLEAESDRLEKKVSDLQDERDELNRKLGVAEEALETIQSTAKDTLRAI